MSSTTSDHISVEKLTQLIETKVAGKEVVQVSDPEEPKIINLMDALKRSVAEAQGAASSQQETRKASGNGRGGKKLAPSSGADSARKKKVG